jgi:tetratricopeptide (TPR) repeat protein
VRNWVEGLKAALHCVDAGRPAEAELLCQQMLDEDAENQAVLLLLGLAIGAQGEFARAQPILVRVGHAEGRGNDRRYDGAAAHVRWRCRTLVAPLYSECLRCAPEDSQLRYCFAGFLHEVHALDEAKDVLAEGLRRHPRWPAAHQLLGMVHADKGQFGAAIAQFRLVTTLVPQDPAGWANLGMMLKVEGRFDAALKAYDNAVALAPQNARYRVNRTVALLHAGRMQEAWRDFECRRALPEHNDDSVCWLKPQLDSLDQVRGSTVLVTHSDGFGDTLQFMRYVPLLAEQGARVLAWVPKQLVRVLQLVRGVAGVFIGDQPIPAFDYHSPFVSLPRVFASTVATIPHEPYLGVDQDLARGWEAQLPGEGLRVGLVWAGQPRPEVPGFDVLDGRRSTALATLAPLAGVLNAHFVSLQMGPATEQLGSAPGGLALIDPMTGVADFADTAAIVANLDVVVSVDTSVVHLAGAMGKPVLMLDRYDNCWRWLTGRTDSPWYPRLRIFRQKRPGEWAPVVARVARALQTMSEQRAAGRRAPVMAGFADQMD